MTPPLIDRLPKTLKQGEKVKHKRCRFQGNVGTVIQVRGEEAQCEAFGYCGSCAVFGYVGWCSMDELVKAEDR